MFVIGVLSGMFVFISERVFVYIVFIELLLLDFSMLFIM